MAFIDVRKAYDSMDRAQLWAFLRTIGVSEAFISLLQSLYHDNVRRIMWKGRLTAPFLATKGLRQGCPLSPVLFAIFVVHVPATLDDHCAGVKLTRSKISNLFYADDIVLEECDCVGMLHALSTLIQAFKECGLSLNYSKSLVLHVAPGEPVAFSWRVLGGEGHREGVIEEGPFY